MEFFRSSHSRTPVQSSPARVLTPDLHRRWLIHIEHREQRGISAEAAEVRAALADLPVGHVNLVLTDLEAQWAAERLGLEDVERVQVEFVRKLEPHPESPFDITGAP